MDIKDIAKKAGVSITTVSRTLNHPDLVQPKTREKIMRIIKEQNYYPNPFAKGLTTGKSFTVLLVVPTLRNPVFSQIFEGCEEFFSKQGYNLMIQSSHESVVKQKFIFKNILRSRFDGVIVSGSGLFQENYREMLQMIDVPIVAIEYLPGEDNYNYVYIDDIAGTRLALEHLLNLGHKNIALIAGNENLYATKRRLKESKRILKDAGYKLKQKYLVSGNYDSIESGFQAMKILLQSNPMPTAVYAFNDILAIGALKAIKECGLKVPDDIAIIGFDNIPMAQYCTPSLTTIHSPNYEMGLQAAKLLLSQIKDSSSPLRKILLPVELIVRNSC